MSRLPAVGDLIDVYGICCEGCGHFQGRFRVRSVVEGPETYLRLEPYDIESRGEIRQGAFSPVTLWWRRDLECWLSDCGEHEVVVHIPNQYYGPSSQAA
jgi:hypothetical protein